MFTSTGHRVSKGGNRATVRWASKKWKFRRRWPVYLVLIILSVTIVALGVIVMNNFDESAKTPETPIPRAIR